jgi:hypothetical protein
MLLGGDHEFWAEIHGMAVVLQLWTFLLINDAIFDDLIDTLVELLQLALETAFDLLVLLLVGAGGEFVADQHAVQFLLLAAGLAVQSLLMEFLDVLQTLDQQFGGVYPRG